MQRRVVLAEDRDVHFRLGDGYRHGVVAAPGVRGGRKIRIAVDGFDLTKLVEQDVDGVVGQMLHGVTPISLSEAGPDACRVSCKSRC